MKLGGSVLTDKERYRTPRIDAIARLATELSRVHGPLAVVHGAGSYGHVVAQTHRLAEGGGTPLDVARVHADVRELTGLLLAALREAGVPAVSHSAFDLARLDQGALLSFHATAVAESLRAGLVPVLSGDVCLDASRGWSILSGDVVMAELAKAYGPERAVFATDVEGIYDRWPGGARLARVRADEGVAAGAPGRPDVTGAMGSKLARARDVAKWGVTVVVVDGTVPGRVADALAGKEVVGTIVE